MPKPELPEPDAIMLPAAEMIGAPGWSLTGKPRFPPSMAVFPKAGAVRADINAFPGGHKDIEREVIERFLVDLQRQGRDVQGPDPVEGAFPDAWIYVEGVRTGLELVEVVDGRHRQRLQTGGRYCAALVKRLQDCRALLGLARLKLTDRQYGLPDVRSQEAQGMIDEMERSIRARALDLASRPTVHTIAVDRDDCVLELIATPEPLSPYTGLDHLQFDMSYWVDKELLSRTVTDKLDRYGKFSESVWLLAWQSFPYAAADDSWTKEAIAAREIPFDEVWFAHIGPKPMTSLVKLWPGAV